MTWSWDSDRSTMPVLVVAQVYRHRRYGQVRIERRISSCTCWKACSCHRGYRYAFSVAGEIQGEQNDFALLNQLRDLPLVSGQLQLL